ncbi:MAG: hypothetical protein JXR48_06830 [Candidatus Delongbacteria bacterium]|nr:hypothetical protein [Candidatus Delongbacteria bacterium]MBN2834665.1 hypothetical protein [Candidatus Delongbacteria bacterium]
MGKFDNLQITILALSALTVILLALMSNSLDISGADFVSLNYSKEVDKVVNLNNNLNNQSLATVLPSKDFFNFSKKIEKKVEKVKEVKQTVKRETAWKEVLTPFTKDKLSFEFFINGRVKITVDGKGKEFSLNDNLQCGYKKNVEYYIDDETPTGNEEDQGIYTGKIISIQKRAVYISFGQGKSLRLKSNIDPDIIDNSLVPAPQSFDDNQSSEEEDDNSILPNVRRR